ncbi:STAS domain-containing protein [Blastococcus montanus]|uniref:STAS domain-containing protein n=1 Tax=Blastococcus montanus TaxID=3144973 RepID=UPI00320B3DD5
MEPSSDSLVTLQVLGPPAGPRLAATGEIDSTSAPQVRAALEGLLEAGPREIVVDLTAVTFLDSAGLCALAAVHRRAAAADVKLRVLAATRAVIRPLEITGLWHMLGAERVETAAS